MKKRLYPVLFIVLSSLFLSCSRQITGTRQGGEPVIYPAPPDTARIQYLTSISTSLDVTGSQSFFSRFIMGKNDPFPIVKPYGIATAKGSMFICDASLSGLEYIDLEKRTFDYFIPKGKGQLKMPANCCVDTSGFLYIADPGRGQVVIFNDDGQYVDAIGGGSGAKPTDVGISNERIFIPDANRHKVDVYSKDNRTWLFSFPDSLAEGDGHLYQPVNICVTPDLVYVTDFGDFRVKSYTHDGEFQASVGSYGKALGQFVRPKGIAVDRNGILFVVDAGFNNVQMFNPEGQLLMFFGGSGQAKGNMYLPAKVTIDYENLEYFAQYVDPAFRLRYLVLVTNQYGADKVSIYGAVEPKK